MRMAAPWLAALSAAALIAGAIIAVTTFTNRGGSVLCSSTARRSPAALETAAALLHYATSPAVPQQSAEEIGLAYAVLRSRCPCNFLVFGLGRDSILWSALNAGGQTLFLEEDPRWIQSVLRAAPSLRAHAVRYPTRLDQADDLLRSYRSDPACAPSRSGRRLRGCRLALPDLPAEVYGTDWDLIMIDGPTGWHAAAPGRMAVIYTVAAMARGRKREGATDVFVHDVNRRVEKLFANEFLCEKNRVAGTGRLWHFRLPPVNRSSGEITTFC